MTEVGKFYLQKIIKLHEDFETQNLNNKIFLSIVLIITTLIAASIREYLMLIPFVFFYYLLNLILRSISWYYISINIYLLIFF